MKTKPQTRFTIFADGSDYAPGDTFDKIVSGIFLISLGVIFLLNSLGVLPWGIWKMLFIIGANLWPVFIILAGASVIVGQSLVGKIISSILWYGAFVVLFVLAILSYRDPQILNNLRINNINLEKLEQWDI